MGDDGLGGTGADSYTVTIERPRSGTEIKIVDTENPADADPAKPQFVQMADLGEANDFARTMHVRVNSDKDGVKAEEVVIVATDIDEPTATPFDDVHTLDRTAAGGDTEGDDDADPFVAIAVDNNDVVEDRVAAGRFTGGGEATLRFAFNDGDTDDEDEAFKTAGTFDGADGTYRCNGTEKCTVTIDEDGEITEMSNSWMFTPDEDETVDVADANYLTYGFWLQRTKKDGAVTYDEVETFALVIGREEEGQHPETGDSDLAQVVGTATYKGGATGVYVKNVLDAQANIVSATSGQFSAAVTLDASFGGGNVAANNQFTIGGTVTKFALEHGEDNDWAVSLDLADLSGRTGEDEPGESGPGSSHNNVFNGVATGDSTAVPGSWNGTFYGSSAEVDHDMDDTTDDIRRQPVAVIGEFNANFTDGTTAGAYGANKK